jgi:hypothetical protein
MALRGPFEARSHMPPVRQGIESSKTLDEGYMETFAPLSSKKNRTVCYRMGKSLLSLPQ